MQSDADATAELAGRAGRGGLPLRVAETLLRRSRTKAEPAERHLNLTVGDQSR